MGVFESPTVIESEKSNVCSNGEPQGSGTDLFPVMGTKE